MRHINMAGPVTGHPDEATQTLPAGAWAYLNVRSSLETVVAGLVSAAAILTLAPERYTDMALSAMALLVIASLIIDIAVLNRRQVRLTHFVVNAEFVAISRGSVFRRHVYIPAQHILNAEIVEGPILRHFGFAKVKLHTIGPSQPLSPLSLTTVLRIRELTCRQGFGGNP